MVTFKRTKLVNVPQKKLVDDVSAHVKIIGKLFVGKEIGDKGQAKAGKKMEPPTLVRCVDLDSPETEDDLRTCEVICGEVMAGVLKESYPDDSYVGLCFEIVKHAPAEGKQYSRYDLIEIEVEG